MNKEDLIQKWLNGTLSNSELEAFDKLENASLYKDIIKEAHRFNGNDNARVLSFDSFEKQIGVKKKTSMRWGKIAAGIAAIFIIGMALFTWINLDTSTIYQTDISQKLSISLPDNSKVELNELSELSFLKDNWDKNRSVQLKGEAFFDVEKGSRFDVNTEFGKISVLGTEFNVLSKDGQFIVSCYEGKVMVTLEHDQIDLIEGTELKLDSNKGIKSKIGIAEPKWLNDMSVFRNASIAEVVKELEKQFKVSIQYPSESDIKFTGAFEHDSLDKALKSYTMAVGLSYTINNNEEVIINEIQE